MLRSGLVSVTFRKFSPAEVIQFVRDAGLEGIEWGGDIHLPPGDLALARQVREQCAAAGVNAAAYGSYYRLGTSNPRPFSAVVETAAELGAPTIRVWAGDKNSADAGEGDWQRVVAEAQEIAGQAAAAGLTVSFEFHDLTLNDTAPSALRLKQLIQHDAVRTLWQPPVDLAHEEALSGLRSMLGWLGNVHVFHWQPGYTRQPLAQGEPMWREYLQAVRGCAGERYLLLEFVCDDSPQAFYEDARTLKSWLEDDRDA
jgi:3-dehydroshikimate dehydratase